MEKFAFDEREIKKSNSEGDILPEKKIKDPGANKLRLEHWHVVMFYLAIYDLIAVNLSYFLALWFRFDCHYSAIPSAYLVQYLRFVPIYSVVTLIVFRFLRLYKSIWKFASYTELTRVIISSIITSIFHIVGMDLLFRFITDGTYDRMPYSYYFFGMMIQFSFVIAVRFSYRYILMMRARRDKDAAYTSQVMLIGAGAAGQMILRDLNRSKKTNERVCCIIDDDSNKWNRFIEGIPIVGGREDIMHFAEKFHVDKIFVAIPSATAEEKRDVLNICKETGCELKNLPGMYQFVLGEITASAMKEVAVEDLLGRAPIKVNLDEIFHYLQGKTILVTGGGGSIGSELSRQIAAHHPKRLIIFDVYENNAYEIEQELRKKHPDLNLTMIIGSVRDSRKINDVFEKYKPDVVYHAAAHKHVPLMEGSPCEAIKNNAIGTYKTAYAAMANGCKRFVLISTDKAVNPTNIMGASKRLCEMVIQSFDHMIKQGRENELPVLHVHNYDEAGSMGIHKQVIKNAQTEFVAVRFGNVLGSNGSVIPLFKKQIAAGGPVTVTHPDIIRYFMTIPEAVSLVLQAGIYAKGGEIFVLDMGSPVRIDTLARNLIKLSGYKPDIDIKIQYTGLRPGEKLFEEKLMAEEGMRTTPNKLIHIGSPIPFDTDQFLIDLEELMEASYAEREDIRELVEKIVPTYHPEKGQSVSKQVGMKEEAVVLKEAAVTCEKNAGEE